MLRARFAVLLAVLTIACAAAVAWANGANDSVSLPMVIVDEAKACGGADTVAGVRLTDGAHWVTSAALSFARGLNDTPKIVALAMVAAGAGPGGPALYLVVALVMGLGSLLGGRRVTRTLATRVTAIEPLDGLAASGVAATLVLAASWIALPVSTTHVASGAIVGVGLRDGGRGVEWSTVSMMTSAWLITVPVSAAFSAGAWMLAAKLGA